MPQVASLHLLQHGANHHFDALPIEKFHLVYIQEEPHQTEQPQIELGYHINENLLKHNNNFILHGYPF